MELNGTQSAGEANLLCDNVNAIKITERLYYTLVRLGRHEKYTHYFHVPLPE